MKWIKVSERDPIEKKYYHVKRHHYTSPAVHFWYGRTIEEPQGWSSECDEWLDESDSEPLYTERDMEKFCQWMDEEAFCCRKQFNDWHCHIGGPHYTWEQLRALYLKTRIPSFKEYFGQ